MKDTSPAWLLYRFVPPQKRSERKINAMKVARAAGVTISHDRRGNRGRTESKIESEARGNTDKAQEGGIADCTCVGNQPKAHLQMHNVKHATPVLCSRRNIFPTYTQRLFQLFSPVPIL